MNDEVIISRQKLSHGEDVLYAFNHNDGTVSLTAVRYNTRNNNIGQIDCGYLSKKDVKKLIKTLKSIHKEM